MIKANLDGKGFGFIINEKAAIGEINPVIIKWPTASHIKPVKCNSVWAATDYLHDNGYYEQIANGGPFHVIQEM